MEITLAIFSWVFSIVFGLSILSVPVDSLLERFKPDWRDSKAQQIYHYVQYGVFGVALLTLMIAIVLMFL